MCALANPRKPGRPKDPDLEVRRRAEILETAARVFADEGFAATDVQVIADELGVGKGTVYRYFPTKEALFLAAVQKGLEELRAEMDVILDDTATDPLDQLGGAVRTYLGFFHRRPEMAELFIQERAAFKAHHRPLYFAVKEADCEVKHAAFFARLMATGKVRTMPRERFFGVVGDLLYGTILTNLLSGRPADPDSQAQDVVDVVLHGVLSEAGHKRGGKR